MIVLDRDELKRIAGGCDNGTRVGIAGVSMTRCASDFAECTKLATDLAREQYPDTRPVPLPFLTDGNKQARAAAARDNVDTMCVGGSGGGSAGFQ